MTDRTAPVDALSIRQVTAADRGRIEAFFAQMGEESASFFNVDRGNEKTALDFTDGKLPEHLYFMAVDEADPTPAGIAFLWDKSKRVPWFGIAVAEKYKGKHLGRRLIAAVRDYCEERGCGGILLTTHKNNLRAQRLYEHCGFERLGVHTSGELLYLLRFS
jgi:RimJ/RimL family protein N-acetyltransferase